MNIFIYIFIYWYIEICILCIYINIHMYIYIYIYIWIWIPYRLFCMKVYDLLPIVLEGLLGRLARKTCLDDLLGRIARRTWETCLGYLLGRLIWIYTCKTCFSHWDQIECAMFSSICQLSGSTKITRPLLHQTTWPACTELCTSGGVNTHPRHIQIFAAVYLLVIGLRSAANPADHDEHLWEAPSPVMHDHSLS